MPQMNPMAGKPPDEEVIFKAARKIQSPQARADYVQQACGADQALLERLGTLLRVHDEEQSFLEAPPPGLATIDQPITEKPGALVGPYKLLEQIGEGGMGLVFMARQQTPVKRNVALKLIKPGMDSKQVIARFEAERQALALMDHPNIARVLEAGTTDSGRPYFVMDLVKGIPITEFCDRKRISTRQRLDLFVLICQAVQHAHQKGIIHRDLKPNNVLITLHDGTPVPKVIDFGVAKAVNRQLTEESVVTGFAQMIGTPLYMSPEQTEMSGMDIDTRTDVYGLGVLLYELLTGTTPFERERLSEASYDEIRRIIREEDPPRPSHRLSTLHAALDTVAERRHTDTRTLTHQVSGELDWIVMKALEKDRTRRYETASDFAKDVTRYLNDEAVEACPPSTVYRMRKFARRNRTVLIAGAAVATALIVGTGVATWQSIRATGALHREQEAMGAVQRQRDRAEQQQQLAEENFQRARAAVDEYLTKVSESELLNVPGLQPLRKDLLESALKYYQEFIAQRGDDPILQADLAAACDRVGDITVELGLTKESLGAYQQAIEIRKKLVAEDPGDHEFQGNLAQSLLAISRWQRTAKRHDEAIASCQQAMNILEKLVTQKSSMVKMYLDSLADAHKCLGWLQKDAGDYDKAIASCRQAIQIWNDLTIEDPANNTLYLRRLSGVYSNLALLHDITGNPDEAIAGTQKAFDWAEELYSENHRSLLGQEFLATLGMNLGRLQRKQGKLDEALISCQKAIEFWEKLATENPAVPSYLDQLAYGHEQMGFLLDSMDRREEASTSFLKAIDYQKELVRQNSTVPEYRHHLRGYYIDFATRLAGNTETADQAVTALSDAIRLDVANTHCYVIRGNAYNTKGDFDRAIADYNDAIRVDPTNHSSYVARGNLHNRKRDFDQAIADYNEAIRLDPTNSECYLCRGGMNARKGDFDQAIADYGEAIRLDPANSRSYVDRGNMYVAKGDFDQAIADYNEVIRHNNMPYLVWAYRNRGVLHLQEGDSEQAIADCTQAVAVSPSSEIGQSWMTLGVVQYRSGAWQAALESLEKSVEVGVDGVLTDVANIPEFSPRHGRFWMMLGVTQYRTGDWDAATESFHKSADLGYDEPDRLIFLAMTHWQLGEDARQSYDKAVEWMENNKPDDEQLHRFRTEAAELLGITDDSETKDDPAPADEKETNGSEDTEANAESASPQGQP